MFSHLTKSQTCSPAKPFSKRQLSPEESSRVLVSIIDCMLLLACAALCWLPIPSPFPYFTPLVCLSFQNTSRVKQKCSFFFPPCNKGPKMPEVVANSSGTWQRVEPKLAPLFFVTLLPIVTQSTSTLLHYEMKLSWRQILNESTGPVSPCQSSCSRKTGILALCILI